MMFKVLSSSLYRDFLRLLCGRAPGAQEYVTIGNLLLTFKLVNTKHLSAESKLTYTYLFFHRRDVTGFKIQLLSAELSMTPDQVRSTLKELEAKNHIVLITALRNTDLSEPTYYYDIVDPARYGMLELEAEQFNTTEQ
ncbi:MAG: hypothetical protein ACYSSO_05545 [Planctomycetota bacterium]|jgi:hypothetical protein